MEYERELEASNQAVIAGGLELLAHYKARIYPDQTKQDGTLVGRPDFEAHKVILNGLDKAFPNDLKLSEEDPGSFNNLGGHRVWIYDPCDGTRTFRFGKFAAMNALVVDGTPVVGSVYFPVEDALYYASLDGGAWLIEDATKEYSKKMELGVSDAPRLSQVNALVIDSGIVHLPQSMGVSSTQTGGGIGYSLVFVANGEYDVIFDNRIIGGPWDTAALHAIFKELGIVMTDIHGNDYSYDGKGEMRRRGLVGANRQIHAKAIAFIKEHFCSQFPRP
jgi:3'-phosphoadenosine 5'-phosphosulfate (PAPS) 3'-phosphatase